MATVPKTKENLHKCICMKCPSYTFACKIKAMPENMVDMLKKDFSKVDHMEAMFCAFGESKCIDEKKGCICLDCQLMKEYMPGPGYFCQK